MESLTIQTSPSSDVPGVVVLSLKGVLTNENIAVIHAAFERLEKETVKFVVADLAEVPCITSAAVGELMGCRLALSRRDGDLVLAAPSEGVAELMAALGVTRVFRVFKDSRSAERFFAWEYRGQADSFTLQIPSHLSFVPPVRQFTRRIVKQKGYTDKDAFRIETIVDEICNNAVEHGSREEGSVVEMALSIDAAKIEINIVNTCDEDRVEAVRRMAQFTEQPNTAEDQYRGRGLALVKMLSSDFRIHESDTGTCVRVTKIRED